MPSLKTPVLTLFTNKTCYFQIKNQNFNLSKLFLIELCLTTWDWEYIHSCGCDIRAALGNYTTQTENSMSLIKKIKILGKKKTMKQQWELSHQSRKHMDSWSYTIRSCSAYCFGIHNSGKKYKVLWFLENVMTGRSKSERITPNMKRPFI